MRERDIEAYLRDKVKAAGGIIEGFVNRPIPANWAGRGLAERRMYWSGEFGKMPASETVPRDRICAAEIWCECFNKDISLMRRADAVEINSILERLPGWKKDRNGRQYGKPYGYQRGYYRTIQLVYSAETLKHSSETLGENVSENVSGNENI